MSPALAGWCRVVLLCGCRDGGWQRVDALIAMNGVLLKLGRRPLGPLIPALCLELERQIMMQNQMRERQMAMQIAWSREFLKYFGSFFALASVGLTAGAFKRRKPTLLAPIIPLGFIFAYQMDSAYGTLLHRMRGEAESIMESERDRLNLPQGLPTFESIEKARRAKSGLMSILEK